MRLAVLLGLAGALLAPLIPVLAAAWLAGVLAGVIGPGAERPRRA